ncbi:MAG: hypothetical protein AAGJ35_00360 [Myxococcota bacterium]
MSAGLVFGFFQAHRLADWFFKRGMHTAQEAHDLESELFFRYGRATYLLGFNRDWDVFFDDLEKGLQLSNKLQRQHEQAICRMLRAAGCLFRGDFAASQRETKLFLDSAYETENRQHQCWGLFLEATLQTFQGAYQEATQSTQKLLTLSKEIDDSFSVMLSSALHAFALARTANTSATQEQARTQLCNTAQRLAQQKAPVWSVNLAFFLVAQGYLMLRVRRLQDAHTLDRELRRFALQFRLYLWLVPNGRALYLGFEGAWLWSRGATKKALSRFRKAYLAAQQLGQAHWATQWQNCFEQGLSQRWISAFWPMPQELSPQERAMAQEKAIEQHAEHAPFVISGFSSSYNAFDPTYTMDETEESVKEHSKQT